MDICNPLRLNSLLPNCVQAVMVPRGETMDVPSWDGTLSSSDFCIAAHAFAEKWKKFNPSLPLWSWVTCPKRHRIAVHEVDGYLLLENVVLPTSVEEDYEEVSYKGEEETNCSVKDDTVDDAVLVQSCGRDINHYDFHILYNASYRVPVLYFRGYCSDGQPLAMTEIEKDLPANSAKVLLESKWTFITQEEHPHLKRPWYTLHPCGTSEWIKLLFTAGTTLANGEVGVEQYLVSWFSVVGQVIGLKIPSQMLSDSRDKSNPHLNKIVSG